MHLVITHLVVIIHFVVIIRPVVDVAFSFLM
jgi:hypothetical protein